MAIRSALRTRVQQHLNDVGAVVWTTTLLDAWMDEGLRRCPPVLLYEGAATVACTTGNRSVALPAGVLMPVRVYDASFAKEVGAWNDHGGTLYFATTLAFTGNLTVEYFGAWPDWAAGDSTECPLAAHQEDVVVFYAVARAYRYLARSRVDYKRYSTMVNNQVDLEDIERLADFWEREFEKARLEARTRRQLLAEQDRVGGAE